MISSDFPDFLSGKNPLLSKAQKSKSGYTKGAQAHYKRIKKISCKSRRDATPLVRRRKYQDGFRIDNESLQTQRERGG